MAKLPYAVTLRKSLVQNPPTPDELTQLNYNLRPEEVEGDGNWSVSLTTLPEKVYPLHAWGDAIKLANALLNPNSKEEITPSGKVKLTGIDAELFPPIKWPKIDAMELDQGRVISKSHLWRTSDVLIMRRVLRSIMPNITFARLSGKWSAAMIIDMLRARWLKIVEVQSAVPDIGQPEITFTRIVDSDVSGFIPCNEYTIDFNDDYGPRYFRHYSQKAVEPKELLKQWAIEDGKVNDADVDKYIQKAKVIKYTPIDTGEKLEPGPDEHKALAFTYTITRYQGVKAEPKTIGSPIKIEIQGLFGGNNDGGGEPAPQ